MKNDPRSCERNVYNCLRSLEKKKIRTSTVLTSEHCKMAGSNPIEVLNFFRPLKQIAFTTARIILHLISFPQFFMYLYVSFTGTYEHIFDLTNRGEWRIL